MVDLQFKIFVEGVADIKFITDYIQHTYNIKLDRRKYFYNCEGWKNIAKPNAIKEFKECQFHDITPFIVFDADDPSKDKGGCKTRVKELQDRLKANEISIDVSSIFLFPNNEDDGDLECLLEDIINVNNKPIFKCWNRFEECIELAGEEMQTSLTIPAKKAKIHTYCTILLPDSNSGRDKAKEEKRNYLETSQWDLDHESLQPLKDFLSKFILD